MSMRKRFCACVYEFFTFLTKGVVHGVHRAVIRPSLVKYGDIRRVKVLVVSPRVIPMATEGELRLMEVAFQWPTFVVLSSNCC